MHPTPIILVNFMTGKRISAKSITEFCKLASLKGSDKYHITPVIQKLRLHHKNWCLPENYNHERVKFFDIYNNEYSTTNFLKFAKLNNISPTKLEALFSGKINFHAGLYIERGPNFSFKQPKKYKVLIRNLDNNKRYITENITGLSRILKIGSSGLRRVVLGEQGTAHKKYVLEEYQEYVPFKKGYKNIEK